MQSIFSKNWIGAILSLTMTIPAQQGFRVQGDKLLDANGNEFIIRGINHAHAWYTNQLNTAIPAIAATGANTVRVVMATGDQWTRTSASEIRNIINILKQHKLIGVLEVHDCTGYSESARAVPLSKAVDYWLSSDIKNELIGQEAYVIINIANEPYGNNTTADYLSGHRDAITRLRQGGYKHALMVDAANWGQDWSNTMRNNVQTILNYDPDKNIIFSVHMYDVYDTESKVNTYLQAVKNAGVHLVVGEFASSHGAGKPVAAEAILRLTVQYGQGYMGWSWKGNGSGLEMLDIAVNWNGNPLTEWGNLLVNNANGLKAKAKIASVFNGISSSSVISSSSRPVSSSSSLSSSSRSSSSAARSSSSAQPPLSGGINGFEYWSTYVDTLGSTVIPAPGVSPIIRENGVNTALAQFSIIPEPVWQPNVVLNYPYVGMQLQFNATGSAIDLSSVTGITLTYKSEGTVRMSIQQTGIAPGQEWGITLPPSANYTTATFAKNTWSQPSWVSSSSALDMTRISGIKWELKEPNGGSGLIAIRGIVFNGWTTPNLSFDTPGSSLSLRRHGNAVEFHLERETTVSLEVFNSLGQRVVKHQALYAAGTQNWKPQVPAGLYLIRLSAGRQSATLIWR